MGTDFFTFKLQLGSLSSILATIAITVDDDLTKAKKIAEQRKLGANVLQAKRVSQRSSLLENLKNSMIPGSLVYNSKSSVEVKEKTKNPLSGDGDDSKGDVELLTVSESNFSRGRNITTSHHLNDSMQL